MTTPPSDGSPPPPFRQRFKHAAFWLVSVVIFLAVIELLCLGTFYLVSGRIFSYADLHQQRANLISDYHRLNQTDPTAGGPPSFGEEYLHPYVGYSRVVTPEALGYWRDKDVSPLCTDGRCPIEAAFQKMDDSFVVGIFGGSVAGELCDGYPAEVIAGLRDVVQPPDRPIRISCLALPGSKQPQTGLMLMYTMMLGARFDMIINLDGFNEIGTYSEDVFFTYPHSWNMRLPDVANPALFREAGRLAWWRELRTGLAESFDGSPLRASVTMSLIWFEIDRWMKRRVGQIRWRLGQLDETKKRYDRNGPPNLSRFSALLHDVKIWKRGSIQMKHLAQQLGAPYYHFVQPNQHVKDSKPLTRGELASAFAPDSVESTTKGYQLLLKEEQALRQAGVHYFDLTQIFHDDHRTLYKDRCCHLNEAGNRSLAKHLTARIREGWSQPSP